ncbi:MAG: outer membrane lipoprotein LolB, partial [Burkholderiaceae bacterium]
MLRLLILAIALVLGACSSLPPAGTALTVHPYQDEVTMNGRLSVRYQQAGKEQSVQGKFSWSQTRDNTSIVLFSPLGQTMAKIEIAPDFASLQRAGETAQRASDVDELTTRLLGWPLPVSSLRDWLQGYVRDANGMRLAARSDALQKLGTDG